MSKKEKILKKVKEIISTLIFSFALIGVIMVMAYFYKSYYGFEIFPIGFIEQILWYVGILTLGIIICFTDIISIKVPQVYRIIIVELGLYILTLLYFSKTSISPFKSLELFGICTVWFLFVTISTSVAWYIYQIITSNQYMKYLKIYQKTLDDDVESQ